MKTFLINLLIMCGAFILSQFVSEPMEFTFIWTVTGYIIGINRGKYIEGQLYERNRTITK